MQSRKNRDWKRRGLAVILTALMLTFLIPMVGLAVDAVYAIRAKLSAAVDAAALASARSLAVGLTLADQEQSALNRANAYFTANFPDGMMGSSNKLVTIAVAESGFRTRTVTVTAEVEPPVYFMRYLGWGASGKTLKVRVTGQASRRDVNVIMVVDRSGSLETAGACDDVENATIAFVSLFANKRDRLGLITFGGSSRLDYAPTMNFKDSPTLVTELAKLYPGGCSGWTGSAQALWQGYQQIVNINEPGALNVILFFTDGNPNAITAEWPPKVKTTSTSPTGTTHCWDWLNNKPYTAVGWNPVNQRYLGFMAIQFNPSNGRDGIRNHQAPAMPTGDPGYVAIPVGFSGSAQSTSNDCYYRSNGSDVYRDVAYIPDTDYYGNSIFGWKPVSTYPNGNPYNARAASNDYISGQNAMINAVDNAAQRIRQKVLNANINTVIYVVGLGGVGQAENDLLLRISNDKDSPIYDPTALEGLYVYAPSAAQLNEAFVRIASEILRYSN